MLRCRRWADRSQFEIANLRSQHAAGQDQRQTLADGAAWVSYLRTLDRDRPSNRSSAIGARRRRLDASAGDTPVTASQERSLATLSASARYTKVFGCSTVRAGVDVQRFPVSEAFALGITSPSFNDPASSGYNPSLLPHDLTAGRHTVRVQRRARRQLISGFVQSTVGTRSVALTLGIRHDTYAFLVDGTQLQPRVGLAYSCRGATACCARPTTAITRPRPTRTCCCRARPLPPRWPRTA